MIRPFIILNQGTTAGRGSSFSDPAIQQSKLAARFIEKFEMLKTPPGLVGSVKLHQRRDNPDFFDLYFLPANDFQSYQTGSSYSSVDQFGFERSEFEQFADRATECQRKLDVFSEQLITGQLRQVGAFNRQDNRE